ncbi:MAG: hypothetical protein M3072_08585 [Candidatus Dormibacteraeota bacterium]|nr:hypothetical protein [Candidatus Dormibacteraeota bacterium]
MAIRLEELGVRGEGGARYSESAISNWIKGRAMPPAHVLLAAARLADISVDQKLGLRRLPPDVEPDLALPSATVADTGPGALQGLESRVAALEGRIASFMDVVLRLQEAVATHSEALQRLLPDEERGRRRQSLGVDPIESDSP